MCDTAVFRYGEGYLSYSVRMLCSFSLSKIDPDRSSLQDRNHLTINRMPAMTRTMPIMMLNER